ncbi:MAG TPA: hypothetical protein VMJ31_09865 [Methylocystis sp.]|nr:hypothetical protein [Methylocystis sp.]
MSIRLIAATGGLCLLLFSAAIEVRPGIGSKQRDIGRETQRMKRGG